MPRLDKTGPQGLGPMTGRGLGHCANASASEKTSDQTPSIPGHGLRFMRGGFRQGRGFRNRCRRWWNGLINQSENQ
ncbi:MAG: DUF5320 domain-containing protein [Gammaproteobacteria bacterium]|nr:DUF5320 domain-containing protein [Gammaproteobacteria bacterium]